jgi:hypothetical protein
VAARPQFRFDATVHAYWLGRRRLPSITQILSATHPDAGRSVYYTDEHAARGTRIHQATARFDLGGGWGDDLLETDVPRVRAYAAFLDLMRPRYQEVEQPRYSRRYLFAGTPDRIGSWPDGRDFVLDLKTGGVLPDQGLQTAGQVLVLDERPEEGRLRYTLHLRDDGQFRLVKWDDPQDFVRFLHRLKTFTEGEPTWQTPNS